MQRSILLVVLLLAIGLAGAAVLGVFDGDASPLDLDPAGAVGVDPGSGTADGAMTAGGAEAAENSANPDAAGLVEASSTQREKVEAEEDGVPRIELSGRVIAQSDRKPMAGVEVKLQPIPTQWARHFDPDQKTWLHWAPSKDDLKLETKTRTAADGTFTFQIRAGQPGLLQLASEEHVFAAGRIPAAASREDIALGDCEGVPAAVVAGRVLDSAGQPVADAKVIIRDGSTIGVWNRTELADTKTDPNGAFRIGHLCAGEYKVEASAASFAPTQLDVKLEVGEQRDQLSLGLERGRELNGIVHNDQGRAVAGAKVVATLMEERVVPYGGGEHKFTMPGPSLPEVVTDQQGRYRLTGLKGKTVNLKFEAEGHLKQSQSGVKLDGGLVTSKMMRASRITGRVVDADGKGVEGSKVTARTARKRSSTRDRSNANVILDAMGGHRGGSTKAVETDAEGRFEIPDVRPGDVTVHVTGPHLAAKSPVQVLQPGGQIEQLEVKVDRGQKLTVRVLSPEGKPVAEADVTYKRRWESKPRPARNGQPARPPRVRFNNVKSVKSDENGIAVLEGLEPGRGKLATNHPDFVNHTGEEFTLAAAGTAMPEHKVQLVAGGRVRVTTHDTSGAVRGGMSFVVAKAPKDPKGMRYAFNGTQTKGRSDNSGTATIGPLVAGEYLVAIRRAADESSSPYYFGGGNRALTSTHERVTVVAGQQTAVSVRAPETCRVIGRAVDASGGALEGNVSLSVVPASGRSRSSPLKDGQFAFAEVEAGKYEVVYRPNKGLPMRQEVAVVGASDHRVELVYRTGQVRVAVTDPDGKPLPKANVTISARKATGGSGIEMFFFNGGVSGSVSETTDGKGIATLAAPAGPYTIRVSHKSHVSPSSMEVEVALDAVLDRTMQMRRGGLLVVKLPAGVTVPKGDRVRAVATRISEEPEGGTSPASSVRGLPGLPTPGRRSTRTRTLRKGETRFEKLLPGRYKVYLRTRSATGNPQEVEVPAGGPTELVIPLPR